MTRRRLSRVETTACTCFLPKKQFDALLAQIEFSDDVDTPPVQNLIISAITEHANAFKRLRKAYKVLAKQNDKLKQTSFNF